MKKNKSVSEEKMREAGIEAIKGLYDLGFDEEEIKNILEVSVEYMAYERFIEKLIKEQTDGEI